MNDLARVLSLRRQYRDVMSFQHLHASKECCKADHAVSKQGVMKVEL